MQNVQEEMCPAVRMGWFKVLEENLGTLIAMPTVPTPFTMSMCVHACVRAYVHVCVHGCVCVYSD